MTDASVGGPVRAWIWGGALLIASVVLRLALSTMLSFGVEVVAYAVPLWAGRAAFAAALLLFAFGWRGRGSVVAGRVPPVVALVVLALMQGVDLVVGFFPIDPLTVPDLLPSLGNALAVVQLLAAIVAVAGVARAGVVPRPWNIAPAIGLAVVAGVDALIQVVAVSGGVSSPGGWFGVLLAISELTTIVVPLLLGILAIVLGQQSGRPATVPVYPPPA